MKEDIYIAAQNVNNFNVKVFNKDSLSTWKIWNIFTKMNQKH